MSTEVKNPIEPQATPAAVPEIRPGNLPTIFAPHRPKKKTVLQQQPDWVKYALGALVGLAIGIIVVHRYDTRLKPVVAINGVPITFRMLNDRLQQQYGPSTIHEMVNEELSWQFAKSLGVLPTQKDIDEKLAEAQQQDDYEDLLKSQNMTEDQFKDGIRRNLAAANVAMKGVTVSEAEVRSIYDKYSARDYPADIFYTPASVLVEAIRTSSPAKANAAMLEIQSYESFNLVAKKYSEILGPGGSDILSPIQLGWSDLPMNVQKKLIGLKISQVYGPVYVPGALGAKNDPERGWWIFKCDDSMPEVLLKYSDKKVHTDAQLLARVEKGIRLNGQKIDKDFETYVDKHAIIKSFVPAYDQSVLVQRAESPVANALPSKQSTQPQGGQD